MNASDILLGGDDGSLSRSRSCTPNFVSFDKKIGTVSFVTRCTADAWNQKVKFENWDEIVKENPDVKWEDLKDEDIRIACDCPANLYWGYRFIQTELDIAIDLETRFPEKNNPQIEGVACKHILSVLRRYFS